jgi:TetR/AcrR family transcriptional repressor of mexJK operon
MPAADRALRPSSERKRAAMLEAARALFLADGYDRTSVDAVAARAGVSKRTVYDHFMDKDGLFGGVVQQAAAALLRSVGAAADEELRSDRDLTEALLAFTRRVATQTLRSSDYAVVKMLVESGRSVPEAGPALADEPERLIAARFADLASAGVLRAGRPQRAAEHFAALTFLLALDSPALDADAVDELFVDGVDAFVRAYGR